MKRLVLSLVLLLAAVASGAPVITDITPSQGFRSGYTNVRITGSGFGANTICAFPGQGPVCPVQVFIGGEPATVESVSPTEIRFETAPGPQTPPYTALDVRVVVAGAGEVTLARGFTYDDAVDGELAENYTRYLVPLTTETVNGANGSRWTTELTFFNRTNVPLIVLGRFDSPIILTPPQPRAKRLEPHETAKPLLYGSGETAGTFLYVPNPLTDSTKKSLRVRDVSQHAGSFGTELPFVREDDVQKTHITLIDIPTAEQYRATLRIYHWTPYGNYPAAVTVYVPGQEAPVAEFDLLSHGAPFDAELDELWWYPSYSQLDLLTPAVRAAGPLVRVEIDNLGSRVSPPFPGLWAFVSVTNNTTQQVTVVTPQR